MGALITEFAELHKLRTTKDEEGYVIVPGRGGHIYEYGEGLLGVLIEWTGPGAQKWGHAKRALNEGGCDIRLDCDGEGIALFGPTNESQVQAVFRVLKPYKKRQLSEEQKQALKDRLARVRFQKNPT